MTVMERIDVYYGGSTYSFVAWVDPYDDGPGAWLGQDKDKTTEYLLEKKKDALTKKDWGEFLYYVFELETRRMVEANSFKGDVMVSQASGYLFELESDAKKLVSSVCKLAKNVKVEFDNHEVEMPEWAKMALAAGWKKPKGWKP